MAVKSQLLAYAAEVALYVKPVGYRLLTSSQDMQIDLARYFIDDYCFLSGWVHATQEDAERLLSELRAAWPVEDYFLDPSLRQQRRPLNVNLAVYKAIILRRAVSLLEPAWREGDFGRSRALMRRFIYFVALVQCWHKVTEPSDAEVNYFFDKLMRTILWCEREKTYEPKDLSYCLGLGEM